ncbi:hypothetical protein O181_026792 [Austropuccinia psidii MF-1]|uniref:Uncharacterized protein n=1 Tax=Austropuccinia psidii MF-1 TaxID=1389203 RepID=A0A9Q3H134_9BASI|nr:hypothetical protein [Austropuccinia psidii MF-1]
MPAQISSPERPTQFQARTQAVLTPTPREPLDGIPEVPQLRGYLVRGPITEGEVQSKKEGRGPIRSRSLSGAFGTITGLSQASFKGIGEDGEE